MCENGHGQILHFTHALWCFRSQIFWNEPSSVLLKWPWKGTSFKRSKCFWCSQYKSTLVLDMSLPLMSSHTACGSQHNFFTIPIPSVYHWVTDKCASKCLLYVMLPCGCGRKNKVSKKENKNETENQSWCKVARKGKKIRQGGKIFMQIGVFRVTCLVVTVMWFGLNEIYCMH